jgi:ESX secretion-associated protein EspG
MRSPVRLSTETLLTLVRWRHGEPHSILSHTLTWYDDAALRALDIRARAELTQQGLVDGDQLDPDFDDVVGAFMRPDHELYGWINTTVVGQPRRYGVLAGFAHQQGFLLVHEYEANAVVLRAIDPDDLLESFLAQLPPVRPAGRPGITVDYEKYLAASAPRQREGFAGFRKAAPSDVHALRALVEQPRSGDGNLYAAVRRLSGARVRIRRPVNYIDTREGRWLLTLYTKKGRRWATARPATRHLIASKLRS